MPGLLLAVALAGAAQPPLAPPRTHSALVTEAQANGFAAAVERGDVAALRGLVGRRVLRAEGLRDFRRTSPEQLIETARGCARVRIDRIPNNDSVYMDFACPGRSRAGVAEEEDPGIMIRVWHHPTGLAATYSETGVQVRRRTRPLAPRPPPRMPDTPG